MKMIKPLIALTPLALIALASCGVSGGSSSSGEPQPSSSSSSEDDSGKTTVPTDPKTAEDYFGSVKAARKRTAESEQVRIYTPHANVNDNIPENGYLEASIAFHIDVDEDKDDGLSSLAQSLDLGGLSIADMDIGAVVNAMPMDFRVTGLQKENKDLVLSFMNSIDERDGSVDITMSGRSAFSSRFTTEFYVEDNLFYANLSSVNALLVLFGGSDYKLPGKGRMAFDLPSTFSAKDLFFLEENEKNASIFEDIDKAFEERGLTLKASDILDTFSNLDYEVYKRTDAKLWTLQDNSIKLEIKNEEELRQFNLAIFDSSETERTEEERKTYEDNLKETLDFIDFDHLSIETRFSSKGITYNRASYKINSFDSEKKIEFENLPISITPSGEWGFRFGLAYQYDNVEPKMLSESQKGKYEFIETDDALQKILDIIRDTLNRDSSESEPSSASSEESI